MPPALLLLLERLCYGSEAETERRLTLAALRAQCRED